MPEADIAQKGKQRVVIVGGGLAGMVVARELLKHNDQNMEVVILEATPHLGGKAGAGLKRDRGVYEEHGYHIFPGWYANTRHLLKELDL
ncbi:MAG: FAD-dependent oxidoreductase, partial [Candidatus Binatia bacterium]